MLCDIEGYVNGLLLKIMQKMGSRMISKSNEIKLLFNETRDKYLRGIFSRKYTKLTRTVEL